MEKSEKSIRREWHVSKRTGKKTGIATATHYFIIQRDNAIRFDKALRISNVLYIAINPCKDKSCQDIKTLPKLTSDKERLMISMKTNIYFSDRTLKIIKRFDYTERR